MFDKIYKTYVVAGTIISDKNTTDLIIGIHKSFSA